MKDKEKCRLCGINYVPRILRHLGICYNCRWVRFPKHMDYATQKDKYWKKYMEKYYGNTKT